MSRKQSPGEGTVSSRSAAGWSRRTCLERPAAHPCCKLFFCMVFGGGGFAWSGSLERVVGHTASAVERSYHLDTIWIYILIAVGAVMMFVGFLGCYGAIQESQCLLGTFFACLVILFACEVAAGIWGFVNKDQISKDVNQFYSEVYNIYINPLSLDPDRNKAKSVLKVFHETLDCCGTNAFTNLFTSLTDDMCPSSSKITNIGKDCHKKITELFSNKLYLIGIAAIVVAVIMIFEMILSMVLCCGIRNSSVY